MVFIFNYLDQYSLFELIYYSIIYYLAYILLTFTYKNFIRQRVDLIKRYGANTWVLVTGATDGIGKGFCEEFAKEGFNIILVSRELNKLNTVSNEIKLNNPNIKTHVIEFDFNKRNKLNDYQETFLSLQNKFDISILVNNVGRDYHQSWNEFTLEQIYEVANVNTLPQAMLCKIFLEGLNKRKYKSALLNLSSFCSDFPFPMKSLYSSTKIFDHYLTSALREEFKGSNVDFLSVKPLGVDTPMTQMPADGFSILTVKQTVISVLKDLTYENETYGHWLHKIQAFLINIVPGFILWPFLRNCWYGGVIKINKKNL
jgi:17beta-estradiol 17-dehydrogenase / very-long-chain 3-oxoacyl-CoA reductase